MSAADTPASATAADLHTLATFTHHHPEYGAEIAAAVADLHLMLHASHPVTPAQLADLVARDLAGQPHVEPLHVDRSFDTAEVTLPGGVITLSIHKLRRAWPPELIAADGPVSFDPADEERRLRAVLANVADEVRALLTAADPRAHSFAVQALSHRLLEIEGGR